MDIIQPEIESPSKEDSGKKCITKLISLNHKIKVLEQILKYNSKRYRKIFKRADIKD